MADDSLEFSDSGMDYDDGDMPEGKAGSTVVQNQPYDEAVDLGSSGSLDDSVDTNEASSPPPRSPGGASDGLSDDDASDDGSARGDSPPRADESADGGEYGGDDVEIPGHKPRSMPSMGAGTMRGSMTGGDEDDDDDDDDASESDSDSGGEEDGGGASASAPTRGGYNPSDYAHLDVSQEIKELFGYIGRYKPHNIELDTKLKCFIPDYIPAVGEIDAFIKVARPDGKSDDLGLKVLDEPSAHQSDPTVLDLQWRANSKKSNLDPVLVSSIEHADKNPKAITKWINSINELHRTKPPPQVHYSKSMPDIEALMQEWPKEFEQLLKEVQLPGADLDMSVKEYAATVCAIMDIPVYTSVIQSLHVLFTLYSEFKTNQHFMNLQAGAGAGAGAGGPGAGGAQSLAL